MPLQSANDTQVFVPTLFAPAAKSTQDVPKELLDLRVANDSDLLTILDSTLPALNCELNHEAKATWLELPPERQLSRVIQGNLQRDLLYVSSGILEALGLLLSAGYALKGRPTVLFCKPSVATGANEADEAVRTVKAVTTLKKEWSNTHGIICQYVPWNKVTELSKEQQNGIGNNTKAVETVRKWLMLPVMEPIREWDKLVDIVANLDQFQADRKNNVRFLVSKALLTDVVGSNINYDADNAFVLASALLDRLKAYTEPLSTPPYPLPLGQFLHTLITTFKPEQAKVDALNDFMRNYGLYPKPDDLYF
jgi:hypothetical protein